WLKSHHLPHEIHSVDYQHRNINENAPAKSTLGRAFEWWEGVIASGITWYMDALQWAMRRRTLVLGSGLGLLVVVLFGLGSQLRREFFPEVDAGAFEIYVRSETGTRIEESEKMIGQIESFIKTKIGGDLKIVISELGVAADWSAAYTPNSGPMD